MAKRYKILVKNEKAHFLIATVIILLILLAGYFLAIYLSHYFVSNKTNSYLIENKYYGFQLTTPKGWYAEKNASYSENNIAQLLIDCKNDKLDKTSVYEIGKFRFESQKYPQGFGISGYFPAGFSSGAILDISVNCAPDSIKAQAVGYSSGSSKVAGEKAFEEFLNLMQFGKTKYISFFHNNFQYIINEYVYVPSGAPEENLRESYAKAFDGIISSFKFTPVK